MRDERGLTSETVRAWESRARMFLNWFGTFGRKFLDLHPTDIDRSFVSEGAQRWCRVSCSHMATALRVFLRYAAAQGACDPRLADTIRGPRIYEQESLPFAPRWPDVQKVLADTLTDAPEDVRDRAILMLLAIYGLRHGEVATLRLDQLDWQHRIIRPFRLQRRQTQMYPLVPSVAESLARYIDTVRPRTLHQEIFIGLHSPQRPLTPNGIHNVVIRRLPVRGRKSRGRRSGWRSRHSRAFGQIRPFEPAKRALKINAGRLVLGRDAFATDKVATEEGKKCWRAGPATTSGHPESRRAGRDRSCPIRDHRHPSDRLTIIIRTAASAA
jgi:integrase